MSLKKKIGLVFVVFTAAAVCELLTTIILGRTLPADEFGRFKFIHTIVIVLASLLVFGQNIAIVRNVGKISPERYNWRRYVGLCLLISAVCGLFGVVWLGHYYGLSGAIPFVYLACVSAVGIEYYSSVLRAHEEYNTSVILSKIAPVVFFLGVLIIFYVLRRPQFSVILSVYAAVFLSALLFGVFASGKIECGADPFPPGGVKDGVWLFLISLCFVVMGRVDQFFIAKMLGYEALAGYAAVIAAARGFELVAMALWFVLMPHYSKGHSRSLKSDTLKAGLVAAVLVGIYLMGGRLLLHVFFGGKFDHVMYLMNLFIIIGFFQVMHTIPSGIIDGRASTRFLRIFFMCCLFGILISIIGNAVLIPLWGLKGSAYSTMAAWAFRVVTAYIVVLKERNVTELTDTLPSC
ncbi:MAG: hypothetical protein JW937_02965 [Candidatus Omnitrophica bacterium]|nr:hypothetical protein [Candidatus Omnitrophota bacterium]